MVNVVVKRFDYLCLMDKQQLYQEITFKTSRSGGAGGQHVNKVSSKVELIFDIDKFVSITAWL